MITEPQNFQTQPVTLLSYLHSDQVLCIYGSWKIMPELPENPSLLWDVCYFLCSLLEERIRMIWIWILHFRRGEKKSNLHEPWHNFKEDYDKFNTILTKDGYRLTSFIQSAFCRPIKQNPKLPPTSKAPDHTALTGDLQPHRGCCWTASTITADWCEHAVLGSRLQAPCQRLPRCHQQRPCEFHKLSKTSAMEQEFLQECSLSRHFGRGGRCKQSKQPQHEKQRCKTSTRPRQRVSFYCVLWDGD